MTPLAHQILLETLKPQKERRLLDAGGWAKRLDEFHFFDVSAVLPVVERLLDKDDQAKTFDSMQAGSFLPAPLTWIEVQHADARFAYLVSEIKGAHMASVRIASRAKDVEGYGISEDAVLVPLRGSDTNETFEFVKYVPRFHQTIQEYDNQKQSFRSIVPFFVYMYLAMINTPRSFGRRQHMPHAGLQRKLAASRGMVGKFPLRGWTEIKLEVRAPKVEGERDEAAYLTGNKALHFCRAHLRVRSGRIEFVSAHWRGDPSLGMKRSRYAVIPPKPGSPPPDFMKP